MAANPTDNLCHDTIHGYLPFTAAVANSSDTSERQVVDNPWLQRMRQIHQLQTAWWVFPTAEHSRFQHVIGVMHLASRAVSALYESLAQVCPDIPSRAYVETLMRMAGLLHDVGHGPFGHFFDEHYLRDYGLTHETLGAHLIRHELGDLLRGLRRNPNGKLLPDEILNPEQVAWLIARPQPHIDVEQPTWLKFLRSLLSGIYTVDNMDFVLRDAYMTGYSQRAFDLDRLLYYSFFSPCGLTIHDRGMDALVRFIGAKADLFRSIYFHRTVRAIDLTLADLFLESKRLLFPGDPLQHLSEYLQFTDASLLVDVSRWPKSTNLATRALGERWQQLLHRQIPWKMVCQRTRIFSERDSETSSIFTDANLVERRIRELLPAELADIPIRIDIARHIHRPHTRGPASGQNFLYDSARDTIRPLGSHELYERLPVSHRICRVYARSLEFAPEVAKSLDMLMGNTGPDDPTNM